MIRFITVLLCAAWLPSAFAAAGTAPSTGSVYGVDYEASFVPGEGVARVSVAVRQSGDVLREVLFRADPSVYAGFEADGTLEIDGDRVRWLPPAAGGSLRYEWRVDHRRSSGGYDSRLAKDWVIFRGDDLLPPARVRAVKGARSVSRLRLSGPKGWSFFTAYPRSEKNEDWFEVSWPDRRFDRPVGWIAGGRIGMRWDDIGKRRIVVAGPMGQGVRHLDLIAFLRWNLPQLVRVFPDFPDRLLIASAGDPMWRGGLSGPDSLYVHADRPLLSGNGTSTLLHELVHVAQGYAAETGEDWIVEAIAEYYALEILRRSGTISKRRFEVGLDKLGEWAKEARELEAEASSGARTARGVMVMRELDLELREASGGEHSLDDVARRLSRENGAVSLERLRSVAEELAGRPLASLKGWAPE